MVKIKLGFLLNVPAERESIKTQVSKEKKDVGSKSPKSKLKKESVIDVVDLSEENQIPEYAFPVDKPKGYFHIEFTLFPNTKPCSIDIIHWNIISKIYNNDKKPTAYKNLIQNNIIWIPVMMEIEQKKLFSAAELRELPNFVVEFMISTDFNKLCLDAKNESCKMFYVKQSDLNKECYVKAYEYDPNIKHLRNKTSDEDKKFNRVSFQDELIIQLHHIDESFLHPRFIKMLQKLKNPGFINAKHYIPPAKAIDKEPITIEPDMDDVNNYTWPSKEIKKKETKPSNGKKAKANGETAQKNKELIIKVSGESYFTDTICCTYRLNQQTSDLNEMFVVFSTFDLTSPQIMRELNPLVIKLKCLKNLPTEFLINEKFTQIYLQYSIPKIAKHITQPLLLKDLNGKDIKINESHVFLDIPTYDFAHFVTSNRLKIELIGVYSDEPDLKPSLFGSERYDFVKIPPCPQNYIYEKPNSIVLAVSCFDLSLMTKGIINLNLIEPVRHPTNSLSQTPNYDIINAEFNKKININQINLSFKTDHFPSPLTDGLLFDADTCLKMQVYLYKKKPSLQLLDDSVKTYRSFFFICYRLDIAESILTNVLYYNQQFLRSVILPNYYMYNEYLKDLDSIDPQTRTVTGFWIDCGNAVIVFLEGSRTNYCLEIIIEQIRFLNESLCRLYHNTSLYHYHRMYKNFLVFGGMYKITFKYSFHDIFSVMYTHMSKYVPKPAYEALKKLELLFEMQTSNTMLQHAIFPTVNELISLNMEFGVAHRCYNDI